MFKFNYDEVRARMKYCIEKRRVEYEEVAKQMGVSLKTLYNYLSGKTMPSVIQIRNFCVFLDIDANELPGITDKQTRT